MKWNIKIISNVATDVETDDAVEMHVGAHLRNAISVIAAYIAHPASFRYLRNHAHPVISGIRKV